MGQRYSKKELEGYFASFDRMGEDVVRAHIESGIWERNDRFRLGAAKVYIRQKDEARRVPGPKWHEKAWGKIVIIVVGSLIVSAITYCVFTYLLPSTKHPNKQPLKNPISTHTATSGGISMIILHP